MTSGSSDLDGAPKLPKEISKDGVKWLMVQSKTILDGCCVWPEKQNNFSWIVHVWYLFIYVTAVFGQIHCLTDKKSDPGTIAYTFSMFLLTIETSANRILCIIYKNKLKAVLHKIYYEFWPSMRFGENTHKELVKDSWSVCLFTFTYMFCGFLCCVQYIVVPYFSKQLPLQSTFPFTWQESPAYEVLYVWQAFAPLEILFSICGVNLLYIGLVSNCAAQFKLIRSCLLNTFEDINKGTKCQLDSKKRDHIETIIGCIKHHNRLISVCKDIDDVFTYFILLLYLTSIVTVCISAFIAVVTPSALSIALTYFVGHMSQLFIYCYMGNEIFLESTNLQDAVYECGWHLYNTSNDLRKSLIMIMVRCRKPVLMSAGGFGFLSIPSFIKIVQFSFSLFTVLMSITEKRK